MSDTRPKTIQIFLPNGNPQGIRVARIISRTVQAVEIPRKKLKKAGNREEARGGRCLRIVRVQGRRRW